MPNVKLDVSLWLPVLAFILGAIAHALSADEGRSLLEKFSLPPLPRWTLPYFTVVFGIGAGVVNSLALGKDWQDSVTGAVMAMATTVFGLSATRIAHDKAGGGGGAGSIVVLLGALSVGTMSCTGWGSTTCTVIDLANKACPPVVQFIGEDGKKQQMTLTIDDAKHVAARKAAARDAGAP